MNNTVDTQQNLLCNEDMFNSKASNICYDASVSSQLSHNYADSLFKLIPQNAPSHSHQIRGQIFFCLEKY